MQLVLPHRSSKDAANSYDALHVQDDEAHVFVGVTMQQVLQSSDRRGSLLVRRSIIAANAPDDAETSSSSGAWQPQDSILEIEPSTSSAPGMQCNCAEFSAG